MPAPLDRDILRLTSILRLARMIRTEVDPLTQSQFLASRNHMDLAAYRLGSVGEYANKLSSELKDRHPDNPWRRIHSVAPHI